MKTPSTKASQIKRNWHLIDAQGKVLGRLSTEIAKLLIGKNKPNFVGYLDGGDYVVVVNVKNLRVTGKKASQKLYRRHSGYPGGFKEISFEKQMEKDPRKVLKHAVAGMLPKNKFRDRRLSRLKMFVSEKHVYQDKF